MIIEPYTYYRNTKEQRVFLVANLISPEYGQTDETPVTLVEWGKDRHSPVHITVGALVALIDKGLMKRYHPKYSE